MTESAPKKRNTTGPLDEFTAAARITRLLERSAARLVDVEKTVREAIANERIAIRSELGAIIMRVPEAKRDRVAKLVVTSGQELNGFELVPSNDDPTPAEEGAEMPAGASKPPWLDVAPEPAERVEVEDGKARRVGPGRK